jgi:splicing factor 3A subunit 1
MEQHMRIELLDPEWKKQQAKATARSATTNLGGTDVAANLKRLREKRGGGGADDHMAEAAGRLLAEDEERRKRQKPDGSNGYANPPGKDLSIEEQIALIRSKQGKP